MDIQVLVATMNQSDHSLIKKMNISTDAIVGNQCGSDSIEQFDYNNNCIYYINSSDKGVGKNRNNTLVKSTSQVCVLADDDMIFYDDYAGKIETEFRNHPNADVLIFNIDDTEPKSFVIKKPFRVRWYDYMRFGAARIVFKRKPVLEKNISFNLGFGGGADRSSGEDTLFLTDCLKNKLKIYAVTSTLARLTKDRASSWFNGYTEKYFKDKGALYSVISKHFCRFLCLQDAIRHHQMYQIGWTKAFRMMCGGIIR